MPAPKYSVRISTIVTMKKCILVFVFIAFSLLVKSQPWKEHGRLQTSAENLHYLDFQDGAPFFWLGVYIPTGNNTTIKMGMISGDKVKAGWFNPRNGEMTAIGEFENKGERSFDVPGMSKELAWLRTGRGCDWVLVVEDASK